MLTELVSEVEKWPLDDSFACFSLQLSVFFSPLNPCAVILKSIYWGETNLLQFSAEADINSSFSLH